MDLFTELRVSCGVLEHLLTAAELQQFLEDGYEHVAMHHLGLGSYVRNTFLRPGTPLLACFTKGGVQSLDEMSGLFLRIFFIEQMSKRQEPRAT